jgi:hypothetical protein
MKKGLFIGGIILFILSIFWTGAAYSAVSQCNSIGGKITNFLSPSQAADCGGAEFALIIGVVVIIISIILFFSGIFMKK